MLLSELKFGSYLTYSPHGKSDLAKRSKNIMIYLKSERSIGNPPKFMSQFVAEKIKESIDQMPFKHFFSQDASLVPIPKSSLMQPNTLWASEKIANALSKQAFGDFYPCLKRTKPLPKAAYAVPSNRPKAIDHYNSVECQPLVHRPKVIVLIDDIITRGSTLLGCASRLREIFSDVPICAFAVIRMMSDPDDFTKIEDPCIGTITLSNNNTFRNP
ncbi:MAG: hypothetical protein AABX33_00005 [Nanoarchaeota archaeon]